MRRGLLALLVVRGLATQQLCRPIRLGECSDGEHRGCCPVLQRQGPDRLCSLGDASLRCKDLYR